MNELLLIGQAPNQAQNGGPLEGRLGRSLAKLFGCTEADYLAATQRFNVLPCWPGKDGEHDAFPFYLAKHNATRMAYSFKDCRVLFIGVRVAEAFGFVQPPLRWRKQQVADWSYTAALLPHASGRNRWWNDPAHRQAAQTFMRRTWKQVRR